MATLFLVQKLNAPYMNDWLRKVGHVFGGESKIGMTQKGFDRLAPIFSFAYMGAYEYEGPRVPLALSALLNDKDKLIRFSYVIQAKEIKPSWERTQKAEKARRLELARAKKEGVRPRRAKRPQADMDRTLYVLCRAEHKEQVIEHLKILAAGKEETKRDSGFCRAMDPTSEFDREAQGWLELDTGWFAFLDEEMWRKTCEEFGCLEETNESTAHPV